MAGLTCVDEKKLQLGQFESSAKQRIAMRIVVRHASCSNFNSSENGGSWLLKDVEFALCYVTVIYLLSILKIIYVPFLE